MDDLIRTAGFQLDVGTGYMTGPKPWAFMYQGSADELTRSLGPGEKPLQCVATEAGVSVI